MFVVELVNKTYNKGQLESQQHSGLFCSKFQGVYIRIYITTDHPDTIGVNTSSNMFLLGLFRQILRIIPHKNTIGVGGENKVGNM